MNYRIVAYPPTSEMLASVDLGDGHPGHPLYLPASLKPQPWAKTATPSTTKDQT